MPFGNLKAMQPHGNLFSAAAINFYSSEEWLNETAQKVPSCVREQVSLSQRPTNKKHPKKTAPSISPKLASNDHCLYHRFAAKDCLANQFVLFVGMCRVHKINLQHLPLFCLE